MTRRDWVVAAIGFALLLLLNGLAELMGAGRYKPRIIDPPMLQWGPDQAVPSGR